MYVRIRGGLAHCKDSAAIGKLGSVSHASLTAEVMSGFGCESWHGGGAWEVCVDLNCIVEIPTHISLCAFPLSLPPHVSLI